MKLRIDRTKCLRTGMCHYQHPDLFAEGEDGYPVVLVDEVESDRRDDAEDAIISCPTGAIGEVEEIATAAAE